MKQIDKRYLQKLSTHKQVLFACFCAGQVFHLVEEKHKEVCKKAIDIAYLFLEGRATMEECSIAANTAYAAATAATASAANSTIVTASAHAAFAAHASANAAYAAYAFAIATSATHTAYAVASAASFAIAATSAQYLIMEGQWAFYDQLLNGDKYFEEIVLKSETNIK